MKIRDHEKEEGDHDVEEQEQVQRMTDLPDEAQPDRLLTKAAPQTSIVPFSRLCVCLCVGR